MVLDEHWLIVFFERLLFIFPETPFKPRINFENSLILSDNAHKSKLLKKYTLGELSVEYVLFQNNCGAFVFK